MAAMTSDKVGPSHTRETEYNREFVLDNIVAATCNLSIATQFCPGQNYDIILPTSATYYKSVQDNIATDLTEFI